ncbi:P-loop NTPase [Thermodesulfobacteriota bacterium]
MSDGNGSCGINKNNQMDIQDAEIKERLNHIKNKILVMSGKGGVGKSSVAAFLSVALAKKGFNVGLMDVDHTENAWIKGRSSPFIKYG